MKDKSILYANNGLKLDWDPNTGYGAFPTTGNIQTAYWVGDLQNITMAVKGTGTIIVYGTNQKTPPDFSASSTIDNFYVPIALVDYSLEGAGAFYPGATGAVVAGGSMLVELDTNLLTWIAVHRSIDTVDAKITSTNPQ